MLFSAGLVLGIAVGIFCEWLAWTRCRRQNTKDGTPSASHNIASAEICQNIVEDQLNYLIRIGLDFQDRGEKDSVRDNLYLIIAGKLHT